MTDQDIRNAAQAIHNLKLSLVGRSEPQTEALANEVDHFIQEVWRLRDLARQAISYLNDYNPERAVQLSAQIDWRPNVPV